MTSHENITRLGIAVDQAGQLALKSNQTFISYILAMASRAVSEAIEQLNRDQADNQQQGAETPKAKMSRPRQAKMGLLEQA